MTGGFFKMNYRKGVFHAPGDNRPPKENGLFRPSRLYWIIAPLVVAALYFGALKYLELDRFRRVLPTRGAALQSLRRVQIVNHSDGFDMLIARVEQHWTEAERLFAAKEYVPAVQIYSDIVARCFDIELMDRERTLKYEARNRLNEKLSRYDRAKLEEYAAGQWQAVQDIIARAELKDANLMQSRRAYENANARLEDAARKVEEDYPKNFPRMEKEFPDLKVVTWADFASVAGLAPGSEKALENQKNAVRSLGLPVEVESRLSGIKLRLVPSGAYRMGTRVLEGPYGFDAPKTHYYVLISNPLYVGKFEVTQAEWGRVMGESPSFFKLGAGPDAPVEQVSWNECVEFCKRLCEMEGVAIGTYRMLTEAEWEYACRAGTDSPFYFGDSLNSDMANFDGNYPCGPDAEKGEFLKTTTAGGLFPANAWGLYDMHGNVWEWCADWYGDIYPSGLGILTDPTGPLSGLNRVYRGGSWNNKAIFCQSAYRYRVSSDYKFSSLGMRIVREVLS